MKDKLLQIRADDEFFAKIEYLRTINGYKSIAETVRKVIEKEYRKEAVPTKCNENTNIEVAKPTQKKYKIMCWDNPLSDYNKFDLTEKEAEETLQELERKFPKMTFQMFDD